MTARKPPQAPNKARTNPAQRRISARVKEAVRLRVEKGYRCEDAARAAGLSPAGYWKAIKRPHVKEYMETLKASFIEGVERDRRALKAQALEVAADLLHNAKSEAVRARMVEFLAGEAHKGPQTQVNVSVGAQARGYEYVPPGARVIDIRASDGAEGGAPDSVSGDTSGQVIEGKAE